jgi:hypothetical protein
MKPGNVASVFFSEEKNQKTFTSPASPRIEALAGNAQPAET